MLLENLRYYKEASKMTYEQLAEESKTPLSTVKNIFSGKSEPLASTLHRISKALNVPLEALLADANVVLSSTSIIAVQETLEEVKETANVMEAERDITKIENERLKVENARLTTEIELLKKELQHKEELLALHNYYKMHIELMAKKEGI
jgi:transcriptional regulator with XRE-family HTH domain